MLAVINSKDLFTKAHALAHRVRALHKSYAAAFAWALKEGWKAVRDMQRQAARTLRTAATKIICDVAQVARNANWAKNPVVAALMEIGCKVWAGKRMYINYRASKVFSNFDNFGKGRQGQMTRAYFDITTNTWCDVPSFAVFYDRFAA